VTLDRSTVLPPPPADPAGIDAWVDRHLGHLSSDDAPRSSAFRGGQTAADAALAAFDVSGYAARRNEVLPETARGASRLSPYIRHGLLPLPAVWDAVAGGPPRDVAKFRDELLWQEYARHLYARLGTRTAAGLRAEPAAGGSDDPWPSDMACVSAMVSELEATGWLVNQARMWLASQWTVRKGAEWRSGEDRFFRHLLDGSRAANRLGWQWTVGASSHKAYGFSRHQVTRRAPGLCDDCSLRDACPIETWPPERHLRPVEAPAALHGDDGASGGPGEPVVSSPAEAVWITAESLGDDDPALAAHPDLPVVFVFDEPLLGRLRLSRKRHVFLAESLADLARRRDLEVRLGDPVAELSGRRLAATFAPVPGWRRIAGKVGLAEIHPWPWLVEPHGGPVTSFSAWRKRARA
jgi:deoxyribodipyrimidine photo-lyase